MSEISAFRMYLLRGMVGIVLAPLAIPWDYVFNQYVKARGDPWKKQRVSITSQEAASPAQRTVL